MFKPSAPLFTIVIHDIKQLPKGDVVQGTIELGRDPVYGFLIQPLLETAVWNLQTGAVVSTYDDAKEALHMALVAFTKKYIADNPPSDTPTE